MRITFLLPPDSLSGGMRVLAIYARRLAARGHHVTAVQARHPRATFRETLRSLRRQRQLPRDKNVGPSHFDDVPGIERRILTRDGPVTAADLPDADVLIATWWETAEWAAACPESKGRKVYFIQGHEATLAHQPAERVDATWRLPFQKITISPWLVDLARERFGDRNVALVPNAADTDQFFAPERGKQKAPTVGFMYSPVRVKGADLAIAAIGLAREKLPALRVICFGADHPPEGTLPPNTEFHHRPAQEKLRDLYAACDAWLFTGRIEGFGLPILEAMACRTPVIGTPTGAAPLLLPSGGGTLVGPENPAALAEALLALLALPQDQWKERSAAAHRRATTYTWDDATTLFEAALQRRT